MISAVNLTEGGPLTVLREVVHAATEHFPHWDVIVAVHRRGLANDSRVTEIPFPAAKKSWLNRVWLEWVGFKRLSEELDPDVWLSLHDITPRLTSVKQYVYCHNPSPFCTVPVPLERLDIKFRLFRQFYGLLYRAFIHRNEAVIVQQQWLREIFQKRYRAKRVIVAHPGNPSPETSDRPIPFKPKRFVYPAFPRVFKNHQILGECIFLLERDPRWQGTITITISGTENAYAQTILDRYGQLRSLKFAGLQPPERMAAVYDESDALIFPSLLETWGLPITEAKARGLPILAADLPYAIETVGNYDRVVFFDPSDASALAAKLLALHLGQAEFGRVSTPIPAAPYANGWRELLQLLLNEDSPEREATGTNDSASSRPVAGP